MIVIVPSGPTTQGRKKGKERGGDVERTGRRVGGKEREGKLEEEKERHEGERKGVGMRV